MAWVRLTADHDYRLERAPVTTAYKTGMRCSVTQSCRDEMVASGHAVDIPTPSRALADQLKRDPLAGDDTEAGD